MKLTAIFIFCAFAISAQTKINFRDGKTITLTGKQFGTWAKPDFFDASIVESNEVNYFKKDGDTLEIAVYSEYANKIFHDLQIFRIHNNQINFDYFEVQGETNDEEKVTHFSLSFSASDEQVFRYKKYDIYSSLGELHEFNTFTIYANQKDSLEELVQLIKK